FDARNAASGGDAAWLMRRICDLPYASQRELSRARIAVDVYAHRVSVNRLPGFPVAPTLAAPGTDAVTVTPASFSYRMRSANARGTSGRPRVLLVTPFAVFPPRHGGARRTAGLLKT